MKLLSKELSYAFLKEFTKECLEEISERIFRIISMRIFGAFSKNHQDSLNEFVGEISVDTLRNPDKTPEIMSARIIQ